MQFTKSPIAFAVLALCAGIPFSAHAISVSFSAPQSGATLTNVTFNQTSACQVSGSDIRRVVFSLVSSSGRTYSLNTESSSPFQCNLNSRNYADGDYTIRAVAYDSSNRTATATRPITIRNNTSTGGGTTNTPPAVSFKSPASGTTLASGASLNTCEVSATDSNGIQMVEFYMNNALYVTEKQAPYTCGFTSGKFADGSYTLKAVATDKLGAKSETQIGLTIGSGSTTPPPTTPTNTPPAVSFKSPASGTKIASGASLNTCEVSATDANGIEKVEFYMNNTLYVTEKIAPYTCGFTSGKFADGTYTLKAVATDKLGAKGETQISLSVGSGSTTPPPPTTNPAPVVSFKSPASGTKLASGASLNTCEVSATDADGISKIEFFMNGALYHTEGIAPYTCGFSSGKFPNGSYELKAVATDKAGSKGEAKVALTIGSTTTPPADTTPPTVSIMSPASGSKVVPNTPYTADAKDNTAVAKVDVYLAAGTTQKLVDSKTAAPYAGTLNTTGLPNGAATMMAVATDSAGLTSTTQRSVTIDNGTSNPDPTPDPDPTPGSGTTLPSTNARAVATFESLGMYWKPGSNPGAEGCSMRYRKSTESAWKEGFPMWYDSRDGECRGSIVHLAPGTDYAVEMGIAGQFKAGVNTKTWSENFPVGQTIQVQNGSSTLKITSGGTKDGYVLYTGPATIDVANGQNHNIEISAPYVIIRGLTLKGAKTDAIRLLPGAKDVVIEDNDISGWGSKSQALTDKTGGKWQVGNDRESAIRADCASAGPWLERTIVQRNKLHHPRYTSISWDWQHPGGPQALTYNECGGNHVLRYNEVYSSDGGNYFNDGFSGGANFSKLGFPSADTDIYGNRISHAWDDAIEAEGGNKNNRIWGNYMDQTSIGIATTVVHYGPVYVFRNVYNRSRKLANVSPDKDGRLNFAKAGTQSDFGNGRRYLFHNTLLQATQSGLLYPLGAGGGIIAAGTSSPTTNTMSRNNILHVWKSSWDSIRTQGGGGNDFNYDLRNGGISAYAGAEANGWVGTPIYKSGHGWQNWAGGNYQLESNSPGYDKGQRLPNFNDAFTGAGPDVGAHEAGTPAMRLGVSGSTAQWAGPSGSDTSTTSTASTSTTGSTGGTTASSGEVCSTALCVLTQ
ncbi:MAG TPA: Ig-like domain-containing protein [Burkholderiales bacterium]|nr:Ig-like domain-containing protein [Burkholderiales bacterium]